MFFFNSAIFIESYLIIYDKIKIEYIDMIYLATCLFLDLYYALNETIIKETLKIFCIKISIKLMIIEIIIFLIMSLEKINILLLLLIIITNKTLIKFL